MDVKFLIFVITLLFLSRQGDAEFGYNKIMPKTPEELEALGLKCIPGRTIMKMHAPESLKNDNETEEDNGEVASDNRRTHMNWQTTDDTCKICVCSVEGKDEYCSKRPAKNVNECIRMSVISERLKSNMPYEHERSLSFRIRRDYIWHRDEIPYSPSAHCYRGNSYYTNNPSADNTTIAKMMKMPSQLDYESSDTCYYCVCSTSGHMAGCITRHPWQCEYYRIIRRPNAARDRYRLLFLEDRPAYFRQLSYRLRRTMDDGLIGLLDYVGDDKETTECIPLLSEYTDCSEANICTGCKRCSCTIDGRWSCETVHDCPRTGGEDLYDVDTISNAYDVLFNELENRQSPKITQMSASTEKSRLLGVNEDIKVEQELRHLMSRVKRSVNNKSETKDTTNGTVKFYHTLDELNEDTLKNITAAGTIEAKKVIGVEIPKISRRTSLVNSKNITGLDDLHIEFSQPKEYDHIVDNKIDSLSHIGDKLNLPTHSKIKDFLGNYSQNAKDKDLSKLVVNELKKGSEIIGDKNSAPVSNITFTPENDTLTAMAFIAGNLLSRLWKIEKDSSSESIETEVLKHEKISDLIELFKEPLTMRQEAFIKTALERLAQAVSKESKIKNISLCDSLASSGDLLKNLGNVQDKDASEVNIKCKGNKTSDEKQGNATVEAITKINNVLNLINKYENIQRKLFNIKNESTATTTDKENNDSSFTEDEGKSLNVFGNLLQKITNLILPKKNKANKKIKSKITRLNMFGDSPRILEEFKVMTGLDINNITLTSKDKLIMDYLNILKTKPDCSKRISQGDVPNAFSNTEGSLINNISKLLLLKSYKELIKSILPESVEANKFSNTTENLKMFNVDKNSRNENNKNSEDKSLKIAKERLKQHINAILEDIVEIENLNGFPMRSNISDILPCIHKFINDGKNNMQESEKTSKQLDVEKIISVFESLKTSLKYNLPVRRSELNFAEAPKSSKVWERVIKNLNKGLKGNTRRSNVDLPEHLEKSSNSFTKLKDMIESIDMSVSTYKKYIDLANVPVASRLMLIKVFHASVQEIATALKNVKSFTETVMKPSIEEHYEIQKFLGDAARTINLNKKIFEKLKHSTNKNDLNNRNRFEIRETPIFKTPLKWSEGGVNDNAFKLTREQILIQLIRNRIQLYLRLKEAKGTKLSQDVNYNVARKIMTQLASGNFSLAKELFSLFIDNSGKVKNRRLHDYFEAPPAATPVSKKNPSENFNSFLSNTPNRISDKEVQMQENFLKQLIRLKTMNA